MKRMLSVVVVLLCLGVGGVLWFTAFSPSPPSITFIGFRESSEGRVAVFRATNSSSRRVAYWGKSASEPQVWYVIPDGDHWKTCRSIPDREYYSGTFTLKPHSSVDFVVEPPERKHLTPTGLGWGPETQHPTGSKPPASSESFAVVVAFSPRDAAALVKRQRPIGERIRTTLVETVYRAASAGLIELSTCSRIAARLSPTPDTIWVESSAANP